MSDEPILKVSGIDVFLLVFADFSNTFLGLLIKSITFVHKIGNNTQNRKDYGQGL